MIKNSATQPNLGGFLMTDSQPIASRRVDLAGLPGESNTQQNSASRLFNVFITKKERAKKMQQNYFTVEVPDGEDEHQVVRAYVRANHPGWLLGGYAPVHPQPNDSESNAENCP